MLVSFVKPCVSFVVEFLVIFVSFVDIFVSFVKICFRRSNNKRYERTNETETVPILYITNDTCTVRVPDHVTSISFSVKCAVTLVHIALFFDMKVQTRRTQSRYMTNNTYCTSTRPCNKYLIFGGAVTLVDIALFFFQKGDKYLLYHTFCFLEEIDKNKTEKSVAIVISVILQVMEYQHFD